MPTTEDQIRRLGKLQSTLLTSGLQKENQPLYQVISQLIKAVIESNVGVVSSVLLGGGGGEDGAQGPAGEDGEDGTSVTVFQQELEPMSAIPGDFWMVDDGAPLPDWPVGPQGPQGEQGDPGPATTDASLLTSGILPDARFPSEIVFRDVDEAISGIWDFSNGIKERGRTTPIGIAIPVPHVSTNFDGTGAMDWTVTSGNQLTYEYTIFGKTAILSFSLNGTNVSGTPDISLIILLPSGLTCAASRTVPIRAWDAGTPQQGAYALMGTGGNFIWCRKYNDAVWTATAGSNTLVQGTIIFPIP